MSFYPMPRYIMRKYILKKILKKINCYQKKILEIGYGAGEVFQMYDKLGLKIFGYDFSEEAKNYCTKLNQGTNLTLFSNEDEIPKNKFDIVVACEVLEHIKEDKQTVISWKKYLKNNGWIIITVPAHQNRWDKNDILSGHIKRYEKKELEKLFINCGFNIKGIYTYDFPSCTILDRIRSRSAKEMMKEKQRGKNLLTDTKKSGIDRDENKIYRFLSNEKFLYPIMKFQELFFNTDFGSAYLLVAKRSKIVIHENGKLLQIK